MTSFRRHSGTPRWSPDGTQIAFDSNVAGNFDIYVMSAEGGTARQLTTDPSEDAIPSWSRDGQWIYFCSVRTGTYQIWKMRPSGADAQQVTRNGGRTAFESPDGQWLYYTKDNAGRSIWRMPVGGGAETVVVTAGVFGRNFAVTASGICFMRFQGDVAAIDEYRFDTGTTRSIATLRIRPDIGLTVSPDEKRILYTQIDHESSNIMLVENYR